MVRYEDAYIGMRVAAAKERLMDRLIVTPGETGIVCSLDFMGEIGVRFDVQKSRCHDCGGACEMGRGWYVLPSDINALPEVELPDIDIDIQCDLF